MSFSENLQQFASGRLTYQFSRPESGILNEDSPVNLQAIKLVCPSKNLLNEHFKMMKNFGLIFFNPLIAFITKARSFDACLSKLNFYLIKLLFDLPLRSVFVKNALYIHRNSVTEVRPVI